MMKRLLMFWLSVSAMLRADVVTDWNSVALDAIRSANTPPPAASRNLAILHAAIYDAVNGIRQTHKSYVPAEAGPEDASVEAAVSAAARQVLVNLYPALQPKFEAEYEKAIGRLNAGLRRAQGLTWGETRAIAILRARASDGSSGTAAYAPGTRPGEWRPTISFGGIVRPALLPHWGAVAPFALAASTQYRPPSPPDLAGASYAAEVNLVKEIGSAASTARTGDQTQMARFWGYGPGTATPPGHWNQIAAAVARQRNSEGSGQPNSIEENARLFALLNIAMADAAIISWDCKYSANFWRPITAIQEAADDGNAATEADPGWTPLLETPPFPEYTSGHSTFSAAAAVVLADFFGTDRVRFSAESDDLPGVQRSFASFTEAALESGLSRIYGGIHFPSANVHGLSTGAAVGMFVNWNMLSPVTR